MVNPPVGSGGELPTSRSMIFVAADGERSMNTYLGISSELGPQDVADGCGEELRCCFWRAICTTSRRESRRSSGRHAYVRRRAGWLIALSDPFYGPASRRFPLLVQDLDYVIGNEHMVEPVSDRSGHGLETGGAGCRAGGLHPLGDEVIVIRQRNCARCW